ncbi:MAG: SdrD B-like domain-containing protein [Blastocatellia bacterium]
MKSRYRLFLALLVLVMSLSGWWFVSTTFGQLVQDVTYDSPAGKITLPTKAGVADGGYQVATLSYYFPGNVINVGSLAGDTGNGFGDRYDFENLNAFGIQQAGSEVGDRDSLNPANQVLIGGMIKNPNFRFVHIGPYPFVWRTGQATDNVQTKEVTVFTSIDHIFDPEIPGYGPNRANPPAGGLGNVVLEACEFTVFGTNDPLEAELASQTKNYFGIGGTGTLPANGKWFRASLKYLIADGYKDFNGVSPLTSQPEGTSPSPQEGEDFSSQWEFASPVKYVAVYANRTRDAKFYVPDSTGKVPGNIARSDEAEIDALGFIPFSAQTAASLRGRVINDVNANGQVDVGERGLQGVSLRLLDASGAQLSTTLTDQNGEYAFTQLAAGSYRVVETNLANYLDTGIIPGTGNTASGLNTIIALLSQGQASENNIFLDALPPSPPNLTCVPACYNNLDVWLLYDVVRRQLYQRVGGVGKIFLLSANRGALSDQEIVDALLTVDTPQQRLNAQYVAAQLNTLSYPLSIFNQATCFFNGPNLMVRLPGNPRVLDLMNQARAEYGSSDQRRIDQIANYLELINNITATRGILCPLADP